MRKRHFLFATTARQALRLGCLCGALIAPALMAQTAPAPAPAATASSAAKAPGSGVYKWKDANGRVYYGDKAPTPTAETVKLYSGPSEAEIQAARDRLNAMQAELDTKSAGRRSADGNASTTVAAPTGDPASGDESVCEAKWREYNESYACFDPYRLVGGGIRPEGFAKCKQVRQPEPCQ